MVLSGIFDQLRNQRHGVRNWGPVSDFHIAFFRTGWIVDLKEKSQICLYIILVSTLSDGLRSGEKVRSNIKSNLTDDHNPWFLFRIHKER
jgi:hypothetical protein